MREAFGEPNGGLPTILMATLCAGLGVWRNNGGRPLAGGSNPDLAADDAATAPTDEADAGAAAAPNTAANALAFPEGPGVADAACGESKRTQGTEGRHQEVEGPGFSRRCHQKE